MMRERTRPGAPPRRSGHTLPDRIATAQVERGKGVYLAFYHWQVYYLTTGGDVLLEEGWRR